MTEVRNHMEAYLRGYLLGVTGDLAEAIVGDVMALAGYCHQPHPDELAWPDVRCSRHRHHSGDHGAFPEGPGHAAVPIRWPQPNDGPTGYTRVYSGDASDPDGVTMVPTDTQGTRHDDSTRHSIPNPPAPPHDP